MTSTLERRTGVQVVELRSGADGGKLGGYALKYNKLSQNLGNFVERIEPGFVDKSLADKVDVLARFQHDDNFLLGRVASGTLRLEGDDVGVHYEVDLPDTGAGRDVGVLAGRGDIRYASFAFRVMPDGGDEWGYTEAGFPMRTLKRGGGQLVDVAPVVSPAYMDTSSALRSLAEQRSLNVDAVVQAAQHGQLQELLRAKEPVVIDLGSSQTSVESGQGDPHPLLTLQRKRFELLQTGTTS